MHERREKAGPGTVNFEVCTKQIDNNYLFLIFYWPFAINRRPFQLHVTSIPYHTKSRSIMSIYIFGQSASCMWADTRTEEGSCTHLGCWLVKKEWCILFSSYRSLLTYRLRLRAEGQRCRCQNLIESGTYIKATATSVAASLRVQSSLVESQD